MEARKAAQEAGRRVSQETNERQQSRPRFVDPAAMKLCPVCGEPIAKSAKLCPACGAKLTMPLWKKIFIAILVLAVFSVIGQRWGRAPGSSSPSGGDMPKRNDPPVASESYQPVPQPPAQEIIYKAHNVTDLFDAMKENPLRAEQTWQDQYVELSGFLQTIDSDGEYFSIDAGDARGYFLDSVHCDMTRDGQRAQIAEMSRGDPIIVCGQITNIGEILGYVLEVHAVYTNQTVPVSYEVTDDDLHVYPDSNYESGYAWDAYVEVLNNGTKAVSFSDIEFRVETDTGDVIMIDYDLTVSPETLQPGESGRISNRFGSELVNMANPGKSIGETYPGVASGDVGLVLRFLGSTRSVE